jgi:hypothetical protein
MLRVLTTGIDNGDLSAIVIEIKDVTMLSCSSSFDFDLICISQL